MHTWTKEEISILKANADLTSEEIRSRFFPDLTISNINSARRKHDCRKDRNWKPEKIERFCALYSKGGWNAVKKDPEFSDMSKRPSTVLPIDTMSAPQHHTPQPGPKRKRTSAGNGLRYRKKKDLRGEN